MTADDFRAALAELFKEAVRKGRNSVIVNSGDLHQIVGGFRGTKHRMLVCRDVMYAELDDGFDQILGAPPQGQDVSLVIEYVLPRPACP